MFTDFSMNAELNSKASIRNLSYCQIGIMIISMTGASKAYSGICPGGGAEKKSYQGAQHLLGSKNPLKNIAFAVYFLALYLYILLYFCT